MLPNGKFDGEINGKTIKDFTDKLNYDIKGSEDRIEHVKGILYSQGNKEFIDKFFEEYFDQNKEVPHYKLAINKNEGLSENNKVCKSLEYFANYILFSKESLQENDYSDYPYLDSNGRMAINKREISYEGMVSTDGDGVSRLEKEIKSGKNIKKKPRMQIEKRDLQEIENIRELQNLIEYIKYKLMPIEDNISKRRFYMRLMRELRGEQIAIKKMIRKPIEFKNILGDKTVIDFDNDTGYYIDGDLVEVSENRIDLSNPKHIYELIEHYSGLKESSYEDLNSDVRYMLDILDEIVERVELRSFERDVLIMKIDGLIAEDILEQIQIKYGLVWSEPYLSKLYKQVIPRKIAEEFERSYGDWFFMTKVGLTKKCNKCCKIKPVNRHHFNKDKKGKDGFKSVCKECLKRK